LGGKPKLFFCPDRVKHAARLTIGFRAIPGDGALAIEYNKVRKSNKGKAIENSEKVSVQQT
jgi:hypothetical protein